MKWACGEGFIVPKCVKQVMLQHIAATTAQNNVYHYRVKKLLHQQWYFKGKLWKQRAFTTILLLGKHTEYNHDLAFKTCNTQAFVWSILTLFCRTTFRFNCLSNPCKECKCPKTQAEFLLQILFCCGIRVFHQLLQLYTTNLLHHGGPKLLLTTSAESATNEHTASHDLHFVVRFNHVKLAIFLHTLLPEDPFPASAAGRYYSALSWRIWWFSWRPIKERVTGATYLMSETCTNNLPRGGLCS